MLLGPVQDAPLTEWQRMININLLGLLYCTHAALPLLLDATASSPRHVADLINISSVAGRTARSGSAVYNATKHAVGAFSEALRQEVTTRYLRVSLVEPGAVDTELVEHNRPEILAGRQTASGTRHQGRNGITGSTLRSCPARTRTPLCCPIRQQQPRPRPAPGWTPGASSATLEPGQASARRTGSTPTAEHAGPGPPAPGR